MSTPIIDSIIEDDSLSLSMATTKLGPSNPRSHYLPLVMLLPLVSFQLLLISCQTQPLSKQLYMVPQMQCTNISLSLLIIISNIEKQEAIIYWIKYLLQTDHLEIRFTPECSRTSEYLVDADLFRNQYKGVHQSMEAL